MDKLQERIDEVLEAAGYGLEKQAFNPFTGPDKTRPGLRSSNSNASGFSIMDQGKGYKSEDLRDYKTVEGRGGKPQDITQIYSDNAMKTISASKYDLRARFNNELRKQAALASGLNHPIQATCAFTGSATVDMLKMAGIMDAIVRHLPVEKVIPAIDALKGMVGEGGRVGRLSEYLKARGMESVMAGEMIGGPELARLREAAGAYTDFMKTPGPSMLPGLGAAAALGAIGGGAVTQRMHEPYLRGLIPPKISYRGEVGDDYHRPE